MILFYKESEIYKNCGRGERRGWVGEREGSRVSEFILKRFQI